MKKLLLLFILMTNICFSKNLANNIEFNTRYYDAANKWIAFPSKTENKFIYGFVYIDLQAGFTFQVESTFELRNDSLIAQEKSNTSSTKVRLGRNTKLVAMLSDEQQKVLGVPQFPELTPHNIENSDNPNNLKRLGFIYNDVGASHNAIIPLSKAFNIAPDFKGLAYELAYAYNATSQPEKAVDILEEGIKKDSLNESLFSELVYTYLELNKVGEAIKTYSKGIEITSNDKVKADMAFNIAGKFYKMKKRDEFNEWSKKIKEFSDVNPAYTKNLELMDKDLNHK